MANFMISAGNYTLSTHDSELNDFFKEDNVIYPETFNVELTIHKEEGTMSVNTINVPSSFIGNVENGTFVYKTDIRTPEFLFKVLQYIGINKIVGYASARIYTQDYDGNNNYNEYFLISGISDDDMILAKEGKEYIEITKPQELRVLNSMGLSLRF